MFVADILHNIPREAAKGSAGLAGSNGAHGAQPVCLALHQAGPAGTGTGRGPASRWGGVDGLSLRNIKGAQ